MWSNFERWKKYLMWANIPGLVRCILNINKIFMLYVIININNNNNRWLYLISLFLNTITSFACLYVHPLCCIEVLCTFTTSFASQYPFILVWHHHHHLIFQRFAWQRCLVWGWVVNLVWTSNQARTTYRTDSSTSTYQEEVRITCVGHYSLTVHDSLVS